MSKIYAVIGTSSMTIVADTIRYSPKSNEVLMQSERPSEGDWVANEQGEWVEDKQKKFDKLDADYSIQKQELANEYTDAQIHGDTDTVALVQQEMTALDEWYDEEYRKIEEETEGE